MTPVRVIAAMGATIFGPAKVYLSAGQHASREHILGKASKKGLYYLDGGQSLSFKFGEEFGLETPNGRLSKALFDFPEEPEAPEQKEAAA